MTSSTKLQLGDDCAWVSCDGKPLPVCGVETSDKMTAWIASDAGKAFTVTVQSLNRKDDMCASVFVDGAKVAGKVLRKSGVCEAIVEGATVSATALRPMHFAIIKTSDDESHTMAAATLAKLGTISIEFDRVRETGPGVAIDFAKSLQQSVAVHEKQKKLGGHHTALGAQKQPAAAMNFVTTVNLDSAPRTVLEFKYRPKDILQAQGIIPVVRAVLPPVPSSSQSSNSNKRPLDESSSDSTPQSGEPPAKRIKQDPDYTRRLEEHIRELRSQLPGDHPLLDGSPVVKSETTEINAHKFFKKGEIIDLTDD